MIAKVKKKEVESYDSTQSAFALNEGDRIITLSDVHFSVQGRTHIAGRGRAHYTEEDRQHMILASIEKADHVVLNGDIFEAVYHEGEDIYALIYASFLPIVQEWVAEAKRHHTHVHMVLGNHDDNPALYVMLQEQAALASDVLHVHPVGVRLGAAYFTHGDLPLRQHLYADMDAESRLLGREEFMGKKMVEALPEPCLQVMHNLSKCVNAKAHLPVKRVTERTMPIHKTVDKLYEALRDSPFMQEITLKDGTVLPTVTDVFTGHTHHPYVNQRASDSSIRFHNTGSPAEIKYFYPLEVKVGVKQEIHVESLPLMQIQTDSLYYEKTQKVRLKRVHGEWQEEMAL